MDLPDNAALWSPFAEIPTISSSSNPLITLGRLIDFIFSLETPN